MQNNVLGKNLKNIRKFKGFSREYIASVLGVNFETYKTWEIGRYEPKIDYLIELSKIYKVSIDYLLGNEFSIEKSYIKEYIKQIESDTKEGEKSQLQLSLLE